MHPSHSPLEKRGSKGGFDAVIGNPPYGAEFSDITSDYLKNKFTTYVWRGESYLVFEQGHRLLRLGGLFGFITPDTYLNLGFTQPLRTFLLQNSCVREVVSLPSKVFSGATVDTTLLFTQKSQLVKTFHESNVKIRSFNKKKSVISSIDQAESDFYLSTKNWHKQNAFNISSNDSENLIVTRIDRKCEQVTNITEMFYGIKVYQIGKGKPPQTVEIRDSKPFTSSIKKNKDFLPFIDGKHIGRYALLWKENNWVNYGPWLAEPRNPIKFKGEKLLIRKIIGQTLIATYVPETSYCNTLLYVLKIKPESPLSYRYLLGILNSRFIGWYFRKKFQISPDDTFPQIMIRDILQFPIPETDKIQHNKMVLLVEKMLDLHKKLKKAKTPHDRELIERQIKATDSQIDRLVYELYGLTEEEIRVVEGQTNI